MKKISISKSKPHQFIEPKVRIRAHEVKQVGDCPITFSVILKALLEISGKSYIHNTCILLSKQAMLSLYSNHNGTIATQEAYATPVIPKGHRVVLTIPAHPRFRFVYDDTIIEPVIAKIFYEEN